MIFFCVFRDSVVNCSFQVKPFMVRQGSPECNRRACHLRINSELSRIAMKVQLLFYKVMTAFSWPSGWKLKL